MALLHPFYGVILPFLFLCTIPFAVFAAITTTIAFCILCFRVALVYVELALAVIPYFLLGAKLPVAPVRAAKASPTHTPGRRRKRRSSSSSALSAGSLTPARSDSGLVISLGHSLGAARDFEGVGGWRLGEQSGDDALWTNINLRLELPADHGRRHKRSLTSGSLPESKNVMMRLPSERNPSPEMNTSRIRTPPGDTIGNGYFLPPVPKLAKISSTQTSGSSGSSAKGGGHLHMKQR